MSSLQEPSAVVTEHAVAHQLPASRNTNPSRIRPKVLLVDDNNADIFLTRTSLAGCGKTQFEALVASRTTGTQLPPTD